MKFLIATGSSIVPHCTALRCNVLEIPTLDDSPPLGPKALGEGLMWLFVLGVFFCLTGFTSLPWPTTHLVFPCPQSPKDTPPTSVAFLEGLLRPISLPALFLWSACWSAKTEDLFFFFFFLLLYFLWSFFFLVMILVQSPLLCFTQWEPPRPLTQPEEKFLFFHPQVMCSSSGQRRLIYIIFFFLLIYEIMRVFGEIWT